MASSSKTPETSETPGSHLTTGQLILDWKYVASKPKITNTELETAFSKHGACKVETPLRTSRDDNIQGVALLEFTHARDVDKVASVKKVKVGKVKVRVRPFDEMGTKFVGFKVTRDKEKEIVLVVFKRHEIPFGKAVVISDGEYSLPVEESSDDESDDESDPGTSFL